MDWLAPSPRPPGRAGPEPAYERFASQYAQLVASNHAVLDIAHSFVLESAGELAGQRLLDLGCGSGEPSRRLAERGAEVTAIDESPAMLQLAAQGAGPGLRLRQDDIQSLSLLESATWDLAVASLCLMDVPDYAAVFQSASRLLVTGGRMVWTVVHPCFGSPHSEPLPSPNGSLRERRVREYATTWWRSPRSGTVRGEVGSFHRPLADYLNSFIRAGFQIDQVAEPLVPSDAKLAPVQESHRWLPAILGVAGTKL